MAFPTTTNLKRHIRIHTLEKPYKCEVCAVNFSQLNILKEHKQIHMPDRPRFQCVVCPSTFGSKYVLNKHNKRHHTSDTAEDAEPFLIKFQKNCFEEKGKVMTNKKKERQSNKEKVQKAKVSSKEDKDEPVLTGETLCLKGMGEEISREDIKENI